ncbi:hypothetical protein [Caldisphaera sp.]|uniref:hypothetical protein n=1 Tax=Caldisphaera sp. TaxID=2060322 RepID=UPI003D0FAE7D
MKRKNLMIAIFMLAITLLFLLSPVIKAQQLEETQQTQWSRSTWLYLPAVEGNNSGTVINTTVTLSYPGTGQVIVQSNGQVQSSTLYSMEMAYMVAMLYAGLNYNNYNLKVFINVSDSISGPSGSFGVMLATYGLATGLNTSILHTYAITGAVSPSGLSGPIGGLSEKCSAASSNNLTLAFPVGNLANSGVSNCKKFLPVPGIIYASNEIYKTSQYDININVSKDAEFELAMKNASNQFINQTNKILNEVNSNMPILNNQTLLILNVQQIINYTKTNINLAKETINKDPYASASYAFTAYYYALTANYTIWLYELSLNRGSYLSTFVNNVTQNIINEANNLESKLINYSNLNTLYSQELMATAFSRIADTIYSAQYTQSISSSISNSSLLTIAQNIAYSQARLESALSWAEAAVLSNRTPPFISQGLILSTASAASTYTTTAVNYANSLIDYYISQYTSIGDIADAQILSAMKNDLNYLLSNANSLLSKSYYTAAIGVYEDALQNSLSIIFIITGTNYPFVTSQYATELQSEFNLISSELASRGLQSSIDNSYMSYAKQIMNSEPGSALSIMETAVVDSIIWYLGELSFNNANSVNYITIYSSNNAIDYGMYIIYLAVGIALGALIAMSYVSKTYKKLYS